MSRDPSLYAFQQLSLPEIQQTPILLLAPSVSNKTQVDSSSFWIPAAAACFFRWESMGAEPIKYRDTGRNGFRNGSSSAGAVEENLVELLYPSHDSSRENPRGLLRTLETSNLGFQSRCVCERARPLLSCPAHLEQTQKLSPPPNSPWWK